MAKQRGIILIEGTIGNLTFFKTGDGYKVKEKSSISAEKIANDPAFERTRENNQEFSGAGKAGKQILAAFKSAVKKGTDRKVMGRLMQLLMFIVHTDQANPRGQRKVADGDLNLLPGFEFNGAGSLSTSVYAPYTATIDRVAGELEVSIPAFIPAELVQAPAGTTHFRFVAAGAEIDFAGESNINAKTLSAYLPWNGLATAPLTLTCNVTAASTLPLFLILGIDYAQEVNGTKYALNDGKLNSFKIVKADV